MLLAILTQLSLPSKNWAMVGQLWLRAHNQMSHLTLFLSQLSLNALLTDTTSSTMNHLRINFVALEKEIGVLDRSNGPLDLVH